MSIFGDQAYRLLRESWGSPSELAEELYAMFLSQTPLQIDGPVTITNDTGQPGLTVQQLGDFSDAIQVKRPGDAPFTFDTTTVGSPTPAPIIAAGGGGGVPGVVVSGGPGTGPYVVTIYPNGLSGATSNVNVTQLSIDAGETIPAGTWTLVTQVGANYYMQVPVWVA